MPRLGLWKGGKTADYKFTDRIISEFVGASGTAVYLHKYIGPHDQRDANPDGSPLPKLDTNELTIQDVLFMENRDRKYDKNVYEMRATYNVQDTDFDMKQFALFLSGDTVFIEFHLNDMINMIGRKIMSGDVIELPHQRDDALLDGGPAINKFYVVTDANRSSSGYSATWLPHLWRVKMEPMTNAQQYGDILNRQAENPFGIDQGILRDLMSDAARAMAINEDVVEAAIANVKARNFETRHYYVVPDDATGFQNPWVFAGDGVPPNGAELVGSGNLFPKPAQDGMFYLRTDYDPHYLFKFDSGKWRVQEIDYRRGGWSAAHRLLEGFINNDTLTVFRIADPLPEKQPLYKAVKPREDF